MNGKEEPKERQGSPIDWNEVRRRLEMFQADTERGFDAIIHHGVLDEGVHFIQKPFTAVALARKVKEVSPISHGSYS